MDSPAVVEDIDVVKDRQPCVGLAVANKVLDSCPRVEQGIRVASRSSRSCHRQGDKVSTCNFDRVMPGVDPGIGIGSRSSRVCLEQRTVAIIN